MTPPGSRRACSPGRRSPRRWFDALEHAQARGGAGDLAHDGGSDLGQARTQTPPAGALHGLNDPDFEAKAADVIGLYLNPRRMPRCSASMRRPRFKPRSTRSGAAALARRIERHGFEYYRHGTLSLYAASTQDGRGLGQDRSAAHRAPSSWPSSPTSSRTNPAAKKFTSSATTSRRTRPRGSTISWASIRTCICITPNLFVLAQPGRALVLQDRARCHRQGRVYLDHRSEAKLMRYIRKYNDSPKPVKWSTVPRPSHHYGFARYSPLASTEATGADVAHAQRKFRTEASLDAEALTRNAVAPFLKARGFTEINEYRRVTGTAVRQAITAHTPDGIPIRCMYACVGDAKTANPRTLVLRCAAKGETDQQRLGTHAAVHRREGRG